MSFTNNRSILLLGADGQVGRELQRTLACLGEVICVARTFGKYPLDLAQSGVTEKLIKQLAPSIIVNAAAYTAVDKAESEAELVARINADLLQEIGNAAKAQGCPVIHYSTDYVFPGNKNTPWQESDEVAPLGVYGQTKLDGENALLATGATALVLRTSWVYGTHGNNFLLTMLRLFKERDQLNIVSDQWGAPTWSRMIAEATAQLLAMHLQPDGFDLQDRQGLYHMSAAGETNWFEFAKQILALSDEQCELQAINTADYPTAAQRPLYSVLDNSHFHKTFGFSLPEWDLSLAQCMADVG